MNGDLRFRTDVQSKYPDVYTPEAIAALGKLEAFCQRRQALMRKRLQRRSERISNKQLIEFLPPDSMIGESGITVQQARDGKFVGSTIPADLKRQWVQGTGPATRPHCSLQAGLRNPAYALLSGADGWMFDGEDALGQIGTMSLDNQRNIRLAVSRDPQFLDVAQSVAKEMNAWAKGFLGHEVIKDVASQLDKTTVIFRPRGLHLDDRHVGDAHGNGLPASIVDAVLYVVNNYKVLQSRGSSIVLYLPKIQTAEEASLWNDMLAALEMHLKLAVGTIKTYVLVEQLEASYQLMEIRAALGLHFVGFNTGRWDYINSVCDALSWKEDFVHPNIDAIVLTYGYMRHYENRVLRAVNTPDAKGNCALWQGGMEANIPVGSEKGVAEGMKRALAGARREQQAGASGKWVAHWKMVHSVRAVWEEIGADNQLGKKCERLTYTADDAAKLIELEPAPRTVQGARALLSVGLQYGNAFLRGFQAAALKPADFFNNDDVLYLMEDMATGEIRLSILWEWVHKEAKMTDTGEVFTVEMFNRLWLEEYAKLLLAPNKDVHDDSKETTLPIARLIVRTYVRNRVKPCWYVDLLNINIDNDDLAVARARISRYLAAFNGQGERLVENLDHGTHPVKGASDEFDKEIASVKEWCSSPRFAGIKRLHSTRQIVEQRGKIHGDYGVARSAAHNFFNLLRKKFASKSTITTFGPYSPGQGVTIKRAGIEAIYLGGWATSAKGSKDEDPGPDLASYPLSQVPNEAAAIVRALLTADKNQRYHRMKLNAEAREATPAVDFQPFIIADADTGHGGDAHVRNLIRRFVEVGVPGYHIEDQRPGVKKCGHQAGKVLVPVEEQIRRLNTARFQLDVMEVPGIIVARTDSEAATYLDAAHDERDHPFILGATNPNVPSYKTAYVTILKHLHDCGLTEVRGHHLFRHTDREHTETFKWLQEHGLIDYIKGQIQSYLNSSHPDFDQLFDAITNQYAKVWFVEARLETLGQAVADAVRRARQDGDQLDMKIDEWTQFCQQASIPEMHRAAAAMGHPIFWDPELSRTPEGFYQVQGGLEYAIHRSLAVANFADILWMETKTADLDDAKQFADAIHAVYPDKMLAYNLSPSFNWDTTGMNDEQMRAFPGELAKLGYVFNFITYGGHQIDGLAAEEFCSSLKEEGMLALARLQRKLRLIESPYRTPQSLVGGPRIDAALMASTGRSAATKAMGKGSTHFQHLIQTELPTSLLDEWLAIWREQHHISARLHANIRPHTPGSDTLVLNIVDQSGNKAANVIFNIIHDRRGRSILSIRDENNFDPALRQKRLLTLLHVFLIQRYGTLQVYYVSPNEYNLKQAEAMVGLKLYTEVRTEVGDLIVADVNTATLTKLFTKDKQDLMHLIRKEALSV